MTDSNGKEDKKTEGENPKDRKDCPSPWRGIVIGSLVGLVLMIAIVLGVFWLGIYRLGWSGGVTDIVASAVPYPVAKVNGKMITYADFVKDVETVKRFFSKQEELGEAGLGTPTDEEIRENIMERMIMAEVLHQEAARLGIEAPEEDIEEEFAKLTAQSGGTAQVEEDLLDLYGWTPQQFKKKVIEPLVLELKIGEALAQDEEIKAALMAEVGAIRARLEAGEDFAEVARVESDDLVSGQRGGELGWFGRGVMVGPFEEAAFSLKAGELSGVVETQFGLHLIKVVEVEEEDGEVTQVNAAHILVSFPNVQDYLQEKVDEADVKKYLEL